MNKSNKEKKKKSVFLGTEKQARKGQIRYVCEESWGGCTRESVREEHSRAFPLSSENELEESSHIDK